MTEEIQSVVDHLFRHRAGQMVATLTRIFGAENLPLAEEVVQEALIAALQQWRFGELPNDPTAWLFQVARNRALDHVRREKRFREKEGEVVAAFRRQQADDGVSFAREVRDDQLRMMLMCCHPSLPEEGRIALTLKTVGGFSVDEIARAFLAEKEAIAQRIVRAKRLIQKEGIAMEMPLPADLTARIDSVLQVLYLIFNEGYAANSGDDLVRTDLCSEAIRLMREICAHPVAASPAADALLALMLLQAARLPARITSAGELVTLIEQDRSLWNQAMIAEGLRAFDGSARGPSLSAYHVEAAIAACHCTSPSFDETDWPRVVELYDDLLRIKPTPVVSLNRAVAVAMAQGPEAGLHEAESIAGDPALRNYLPLAVTIGELSLRSGDRERARAEFERALLLPGSLPEKRFLTRKLRECTLS